VIDNLKKRLAELYASIEVLSDERDSVRTQIAQLSTSLKVGDRVSYDGASCVWELRAINPGYGATPKFFGSKIKKDGTPGVAVNEIYQVPYGKVLKLASTSAN